MGEKSTTGAPEAGPEVKVVNFTGGMKP